MLVPQPVLVHRIILSSVPDFAFVFIELLEVPVSPFLQLVKIHMSGSRTLHHVNILPNLVPSTHM